jgi:hypothetical protein
MAVLSKHFPNSDVCRCGCQVLDTLAGRPDNKAKLKAAGAVQLLKDITREPNCVRFLAAESALQALKRFPLLDRVFSVKQISFKLSSAS